MRDIIEPILGFIFVVLGGIFIIYFIAINEYLGVCPCIIAVYVGMKLTMREK